MNSFRVIDTRFRILKGGKIGLSLSISLIGSALVFGNINAYSQTFFDGITDGTTFTSGDVSAQEKSDDGDSTDVYNTISLTESIVFRPQRVVSSYVGVADYEVSGASPNQSSDLQGSIIGTSSGTYNSVADGTYTYQGVDAFGNPATLTGINYDRAYYQIFTPSTNFTVTLNATSTVNNIIKDNSQYYNVNSSTGYDIQNTSYTANVVFTGSNRVYGSTNIGDGNIKLDGSVIFDGTVNAGSISVDTANTIIFNSAVDLTAGTTDNMNFSTNGNVLLNSNFTGNITTTADNQGNVIILGDSSGKEQIIAGNIGSLGDSINVLNIGESGSLTNYSRTIVNGDVFANSTVLNNTTTNSSTLILSNDKNITSTITTSHDNKGILTLSGGTQTVTGQVGTDSFKLAEVNTGYGTTTFTNNVYATYLDVEGTGIVNLNGSFTGTAIRYNADGTANLYNGLTGNVTTNSAGTGTLNLVGSNNQTVNGNVGVGNALKDVNSGVNGTTSTFAGTVNSQNITNTGTGTTIFQNDVTATNVNVNAGTSTFEDNLTATTTTITTGIGNFNTLSGTTSSNIVFGGIGEANLNNGLDGNINFANYDATVNIINGDITGNITSTGTNGNLNISGTTTISGTVDTENITNIGTGTTIFQDNVIATNVNVNAGTSTFEDNLTATTTTITTGIGNFNTLSGTTSSNIVFGGDGTVNLYNGLTGNVTTNSAGTGTLNLVGSNNQTVNGNVGVGNALKDVNSGVNGTTSTFAGTVNSQNITNTGTGTTIFQNDVTATNVNVNAGTSTFEDNLTATTTTITTGIGNFNTLSGTTSSNIVFGGIGEANLNNGLDGNINFANYDATVNIINGDITGNITSTGTNGNLNISGTTTISGTVDTENITNIGTGTTIFQDNVIATNVNVNAGTSTFEDNLTATTTTITTGIGNFNTLSGTTSSNIVFGGDGTANLYNGLTGNVTTNSAGTGTLNLVGSNNQTVNGNVGVGNALKDVNSGVNGTTSTFAGTVNSQNITNTGTGTTIFQNDVTATNVNVNAGTSTFENNLTATTTTITTGIGNFNTLSGTTSSNIVFGGIGEANLNNGLDGNINFANYDATVNIINGDITGNITSTGTNGNLNISGTTTISGTVDTENITNIGTGTTIFQDNVIATNVNVNAGTSTFEDNLTATTTTITTGIGNFNTLSGTTSSNIVFGGDGTANLYNGLTGNVTTNSAGTGTLNLVGSNNQTVNGNVGVGNALKDVNSGVNGTTSTFAGTVNSQNITNTGTGTTIFQNDVTATNVNVNAGTSTFEDNLTATTTTITTGIGNFNAVSGTTNSNIVFSGNGTANLNQGLTGNIYFAGNDANINVADGKGILGSVETLANNTGILNFKGDGVIDGIIGSADFAIKELNVNSEDEQDKDENGTVITQGLLAHREIFAEIINLRNNATLTLANNANVTKTSTGLVISTDNANSGNVVFLGSSTVTGEVGTNSNNLESITAGANNETVTFNDMVYASILNYSDDGTVVLNGDNSLNANAEGFKGTVNFDSFAGKLEIGDDVNLTIGTAGTQFVNANNATLTFNGTSTIYGTLGGSENGLNDTFKTINAGASNETVKFEDNVYVMDSLNLISSNGKVQIADGNYVKRNSNSTTTGAMITTSTDGFGDLEYLGTTILNGDIGTSSSKLNNVTFASTGNTSNIYNQDIDKNVYALNTYIGNGSNKTTLNIKEDITFGGNLNLRKDSVLDVSDYNVTVDNNLDIASNSILEFKVYTTDLSAGQAVENGNSGKIVSQSLTMANDAKINIDYDGTWEGAGKYNLIEASSITTDYYGTEENGLISDNSIIDSIVTKDGTNLTLFADRTSGGSFNPEDLYIEKSEIGKDYSNGASQSLAGYANEKNREGALANIIREMEYFEGGTDVSEAKKQEMIEIQRLLAPTANNSNIQSTITATNLSASTIKGRLSDIRVTQGNNFTPNTYNSLGLSSGDYYTFDTSFWLKAMASKATQDKIKEYDGFDASTYGFVGGMDKISSNGTIFGVALSYSTTKTKQEGLRTDDSDTTSVQATLYSSQEIGDAYVDGYLSYGKHKTDATRTANSGKLNSSVNSDQISAKIETGYKIPLNDGISLTPFASLEYSLLNQKGYTEKGTTYQNDALKVDNIKLNRGTAELGAKLVTNIEFDDTLIIPQFSASVYNSFGSNKPDVKAQFVGGGNKFITPVPMMNDTMFNLGLGVETKISDSTSLIFDVDYDRSKDGKFEAYSGNVTFGVSF